MLYNNWKKDNFSAKSRHYDSLRLFIKGLKDVEWEL